VSPREVLLTLTRDQAALVLFLVRERGVVATWNGAEDQALASGEHELAAALGRAVSPVDTPVSGGA
jgi:hypothetical protein